MDKIKNYFTFQKWFYYLDPDICYDTNIIKINHHSIGLILNKNDRIIHLLYKIFNDLRKGKTSLMYYLHLLSNVHQERNINNLVEFTDFLHKKENYELLKENYENKTIVYIIQQYSPNKKYDQFEIYRVTILDKKIRVIYFVNSYNCDKKTAEIYKCIKKYLINFIDTYVIDRLHYYNYNLDIDVHYENGYIKTCKVFNVTPPKFRTIVYPDCTDQRSLLTSTMIIPSEQFINFTGTQKIIQI